MVRRLATLAQRIVDQTRHAGADAFRCDATLRAAVLADMHELVRVAGELSADFLREHDEIPWLLTDMRREERRGTRAAVNPDVLWAIIARDVPPLATELAALCGSD